MREGTYRFFFAALVTIILSVAPFPANAVDGQEAICSSSEVFFCENFEDRSLIDYKDMKRAKYKNRGWELSNDVSSNESEKVVNTQFFEGTKGFQIKYNPGSNGAGYLNAPVDAKSDVFIRWYSKWSANFMWSGTSTKNFEFYLSAGNPGNIHLWSSNFGDSKLHIQTNNASFQRIVSQNVQPLYSAKLNEWICLEAHIRVNSGLSQTNGIIEAWVNGEKKIDYQAIEVWNAPATVTGLMMSGYWNCAVPPGNCASAQDYKETMYRWVDNIVMSTSRVGCLSGAPDLRPKPPLNLRTTN